MNRLNQIAQRLIPAAAAAGITLVLFAAVVSVGEPQRSQTIATNMLARQAEVVAKARQPEGAMAANESPKSAATLAVAFADNHRHAGR